MDFKTVTEQFASSVPGTDAFLKVKEQSLALMSADPDHAAAYFLVYGFARSYVILHDDEGITTDVANAAQAQLLGYMRSIEQSLSGGDKELLGAMNRIVLDYDGRRQLF
ncbi:conserved protein of unknown function (plasmid) [Cupriavidus taiwanensis]|uniref:Uncharacterized protein n=1 Tax=Cupriavidus taiwanensis TaxID=164546 RepID=A0A9Q7XWQ5_9BURK|nr:hypothetical protein [Cupriavidus taiwanensis]SPD68565.1 conserved protein of unknown function [Cupriavidus taiwanensis]